MPAPRGRLHRQTRKRASGGAARPPSPSPARRSVASLNAPAKPASAWSRPPASIAATSACKETALEGIGESVRSVLCEGEGVRADEFAGRDLVLHGGPPDRLPPGIGEADLGDRSAFRPPDCRLRVFRERFSALLRPLHLPIPEIPRTGPALRRTPFGRNARLGRRDREPNIGLGGACSDAYAAWSEGNTSSYTAHSGTLNPTARPGMGRQGCAPVQQIAYAQRIRARSTIPRTIYGVENAPKYWTGVRMAYPAGDLRPV